MRLIYLGTPTFAAYPLEALVQAGYEIAAVITQPDRPAGRHGQLRPPPVKVVAEQLGLRVLQPETLRDEGVVEQLRQLQPDVGIVAAYGEILRRNVLEIPPLGYLNIHPSLLPFYRGPSPVTAAILAGDEVTGVTIMKLERAMDAGPILAQATIPLQPTARTGPLTEELFRIGAQLLLEVLPLYASGAIVPHEQDHSRATVTKLLAKEDGIIDWSLPAIVIERMTRAYDSWPGARTTWRGQQLLVRAARVHPDWHGPEPPGTVLNAPSLLIATGSGALELLEVQPAGKRPMPGDAFKRGQRDIVGQRLGDG
ncbi:MAG: methionyl-tRNA formyltransferase [Herpetosiphonaceae bacterium]|nr:MAG: methionyl-tRNA formyltransferase [Herpetosiphonaceae bacterium]